jgi:hypothetical protein
MANPGLGKKANKKKLLAIIFGNQKTYQRHHKNMELTININSI